MAADGVSATSGKSSAEGTGFKKRMAFIEKLTEGKSEENRAMWKFMLNQYCENEKYSKDMEKLMIKTFSSLYDKAKTEKTEKTEKA